MAGWLSIELIEGSIGLCCYYYGVSSFDERARRWTGGVRESDRWSGRGSGAVDWRRRYTLCMPG